MNTAAEQEAERRWPVSVHPFELRYIHEDKRIAFVEGVEWALEQHRELLEAAREYRATVATMRADPDHDVSGPEFMQMAKRLLAAAAALHGGTGGANPSPVSPPPHTRIDPSPGGDGVASPPSPTHGE